MQKIILKIYVKNKRRPFAVIETEDPDILKKLYAEVNLGRTSFLFHQVLINMSEFKYATITYK